MGYYKKYKNKYNLIKQIGGGIKEYLNKDIPVLQSIFTDITKFSEYQFSSNPISKQALIKLISDKLSDCIVIEVRGNGLCLLNAVCAVFFIMQRVKNISSLLSLELLVHNKNSVIPYANQLNISITEYIMVIYRRVNDELIPMSNKIVALIIEKMRREDSTGTYDSAKIYDMYHYRKDMNAENYEFFQLGQILSTFLGCVIILLDENEVFHGVFPNGEELCVCLENIKVEEITDNINKHIWDVIFIINVSGRHFHSLIPLADSDDIKANNIKAYNSIKRSILWR